MVKARKQLIDMVRPADSTNKINAVGGEELMEIKCQERYGMGP